MATSAVSFTLQRKIYASQPAPLSDFTSALKTAGVYHATPKIDGAAPQPSTSVSLPDSRYQPIEFEPWELVEPLPKQKEIIEAMKLPLAEAQPKLEGLLAEFEKKRHYQNQKPEENISYVYLMFQCLLTLYKISATDRQKNKYLEELPSLFRYLSIYNDNWEKLNSAQKLYFTIIEHNLILEQLQIRMYNDNYKDLSYEEIDNKFGRLKTKIKEFRSELDPLPIEIRENEEIKKYREYHTELDELPRKNSNNKVLLTRAYIEISQRFGEAKNPDEWLILARCSLGRAREGTSYIKPKTQEALNRLHSMEDNISQIENMEHRIVLWEKLATILAEVRTINPALDTSDREKACRQQIQSMETAFAAKIQENARMLKALSATINSCSDLNNLEAHLEALFNALKESAQWTTKTCPSAKKDFFTAARLAINSLNNGYQRLGQSPHPLAEKILQYCQAKEAKIIVIQPEKPQQERSITSIAWAILAGIILCTVIVAWRSRSIQRLT